MAYKYDSSKSAGRTYTNWTNKRGTSNQQLQAIPPITNTANGKRYYSSIDAELYFGDIFIDEVTNIAWSIQQQSLPLYGYNSYTFDDMAIGSRLIQGQFAINFTERNFLSKLQSDSSFQKIARRMYGEDISVADTAVGKLYSDFRQKLHLPVWDKGFDIVIGFGEDPKSGTSNTYGTYLVLNCVQITGSTMQLDYNGDPLQEIYTFMARDIKETFSDAAAANPSTVNSEKLYTNSGSQQDLQLTGVIDLTKSSGQLTLSSPSSVTFSEGTYQLTDTFTDKSLGALTNLVCSKNTMATTLTANYIASFKKECANKTSVVGIVKCKYTDTSSTSSTKGQTVSAQVTVQFSIKK